MFKGGLILVYILAYLCVLFLIAYYADRREKAGRSIVSNPYIYSLSLAVYCTSWTFYGSVGKAATSGLPFLTIYIGPTLIAGLWWIVLRKIINIAKNNRITTISDFIGSRYGNSIFLSALVAIVAVVGITPYLGLQIKAIMSTFVILAGQTAGSTATGWLVTLILGIFAIIFGARKLVLSERHEGLIFAIAFESLVKLVAFMAVGVFVTYGIFDGFIDIFDKIKETQYGELLFLGGGTSVSYHQWASLMFLSMMAVMFLPRQFHVSVVENSDVSHVSKAMWLFPLYLFLINIFVIPVAFGGLLLGGSPADADNFVLTVPLGQGNYFLALFVFIGGFSAATGMIIVESLALSTMVMNNLVMPTIYRFNEMRGFPTVILNLKRVIILGCVFLGYFFAVSIGEFYSLVDIGLKSFEAVTIFAPSILIGLYWKRGNKAGAMAGIIAGFLIWFYTLLVPALLKAGIIAEKGVMAEIINSSFLNPRALFGLVGLDKWSHSLFWGLLFNVLLYVGVSIFTRQSPEEERQSFLFVDSYTPRILHLQSEYGTAKIEDILGQYIGRSEAQAIVERFLRRNSIQRDTISQHDLIRLRDEAELVLSGALGSAISSIIFEDRMTLTEKEREELSSSIKHMTDSLRLSRQELADANRQLASLKEFSENIIESISLGVATVDEQGLVRYWNRYMEDLTKKSKKVASGKNIRELLGEMNECFIGEDMKIGEFLCEKGSTLDDLSGGAIIKIFVSPFRGSEKGYVLVFEDITEKKRLERELALSAKHASLGKLTAGVSHEIGNPLASISSLVQELKEVDTHDGDTEQFGEHALTAINIHLDRISKIVRSLGDFSRISSPEKQPTNIAEILERTLNLVRYDKRSKNIEFDITTDHLPLLLVNPDQIQQVFLNLMLNALDAMPAGGRLKIMLKATTQYAEISFGDSGSGIESEIMDRIFDPFFTTKPPGKGTGLGLSICYGIINDHSGAIDVTSKKGEGTLFVIRLPLDQ
ncbi:MAG: PAS domain S-box protein [Nitrospiraceae bacterium]|nr:MAG: PAS domain S-box protein [Nitrospiraceae bacterium]